MKSALQISGLVLLAGLIGLGLWLKTPAPAAFDRQAALETAKDYQVRIVRDAYGVPHIYGTRDADVAFGLAYAHAEDDIINMQDSRRFARGQMGLATGTEGAITDYLVATMQAHKFAEEKYEAQLSADTRSALEGYAAGINLYCAEETDRCEPGFAPITPIDIVSSYVSRTPFFYGLDRYLTELFDGDVAMVDAAEATREAYLGSDHRITPGSNAIAVAPSRSTDGHTRLMVNSHQPFIGPVAWYEARVKSEEGWDMVGGLFPGTPLISLGASPKLGWAITVNKPDLVDFYQLTVNDEKVPTQYMFDGAWRDFETETITIRVKLWGPFSFPSKQTLRRSVHGPVFDTPNGFVAVAFAGAGNIRAVEQWFRMNKSQTYAEWQEAMAVQGIPSFNFVYGDAEGNIGYYYNALVPIRSPQWDWSKMAPGDRSDLVWQGTRPFGTATPLVSNPSSGYVINSNHTPFESTGAPDKPKRADFPAHYGISDLPTNRGLRAQALYGGDLEISGEEFVSYKMDTRFDPASAIMTHLRTLATSPDINTNPDFADALALFSDWDGHVTSDSRVAGLAIRATQLANGIEMRGDGAEVPDHAQALSQAIAEYIEGFGRIDPEWRDVNRHKRGDLDIPVNGAPDVLRAIYSIDNPKDGSLGAIAGDSYILYADWDETGKPTIQTIHQYGAATHDETSPHYADQTKLFADEGFRTPPMTLEAVLAEATRDYVVGGANAARAD
jgi:penicillin amidase/acyl-homoserine-lactone acylase